LVTADEVLTKAYDVQPQIKAAESRIRSAEAQTEVSKQLSGLH
jgi:outer membrane protein